MNKQLEIIAHIYTDFPTKFGIPRQSGLVEVKGRIVFEPKFRDENAVRGMEDYSHLWLIWDFSENGEYKWSPTVRPPRLGGNTRVGVFATRSPFRPNQMGLSCVKLDEIRIEDEGPVLYVSGVDLMNGTPIYDIKPYLAYVDSHPEARGGFADERKDYKLSVTFHKELRNKLSKEQEQCLIDVLEQDPRPSYQEDSERIYGMEYAGKEIKFKVADGVLTICEIE